MSDHPLDGYTGPTYVTVDYDESPFNSARQFTKETRDIITEQFSYLKTGILGDPGSVVYDAEAGWTIPGNSANMLGNSTAAITALANFDFTLPEDLAMVRPEINWTIDIAYDLPPVDQTTFGEISPWDVGGAPNLGTLPGISTVSIPAFESSIADINIPPSPLPALIPEPGPAPTSPGFSFPPAPPIVLPDRPMLNNVVIPEWEGVDLPTLEDLTFPDLEAMNINTYINWAEPTYIPEVWGQVKAQIERFFAGGSGIRPEIEEAMVARGRDREDRLVRQQEAQATDEWAGRGYTAPPGMLVKRIDNIREEGLLKKLSLQRDIVIKAMDEELVNIRLAVQQGIAAEQLFVQIHLAAVDRLFQIEKLHIEWEIQKYNLLVEVFKARFQENLIRAQVFEIRVRAALAEIEIFKALIDAERVKAEINTTLIQSYTAEIQARESLVELYKAQVEAVGIQARVFETEVRAYGEEVDAFASRVNADKLRFDAYASRISGEVAKADIIRAEAQAYSAQIQGIATGTTAEVAALEGYVSGFNAEVRAYEALLQGHIGKNQAELAALQGNVAGYQADTQRFIAATNVQESKSRVELAAWESENRLNLGWFEAQIKEFEVQINKIISQKNLILDALKSAGGLASTVSAGALAAMHAGATITGNSGLSATGNEGRNVTVNDSWSRSCSTDTSVNISVNQDSPPNLSCPFP